MMFLSPGRIAEEMSSVRTSLFRRPVTWKVTPLTRAVKVRRPGSPFMIWILFSACDTRVRLDCGSFFVLRWTSVMIGSQVTTLPARSVTWMVTWADCDWLILVAVMVTGSVVPTVNGGTGVSALSDWVTTMLCRPVWASETVTWSWVGGPAITRAGQVAPAMSSCWTRRAATCQSSESGFWPAGAEFICTVVVPTPDGMLMDRGMVLYSGPWSEFRMLYCVGLLLIVVLSGRSVSPSPAKRRRSAARFEKLVP